MEYTGFGKPTKEEYEFGDASFTEVHQCKKCGNQDVRFPRFDDPWLLILNPEYRRGRCSEWGHVFTCNVGALMGFDRVRLIKDWSDHVWTEVLITDLNEDNGVS